MALLLGAVLAVGVGVGWFGRGHGPSPAVASKVQAPTTAPVLRATFESAKVARSTDAAATASVASASPSASPEPVIYEPEPQAITAEEERDQKIDALRRSGRDKRNFIGTVLRDFKDWDKALANEPKVKVELGPWSCFAGGCFIQLVHDSIASVSESTRRLTATDSFLRWNSGKMRSGEIVRPDGKVEVTWVLFAPPEAARTMQELSSAE
jgi:hypothetical protein